MKSANPGSVSGQKTLTNNHNVSGMVVTRLNDAPKPENFTNIRSGHVVITQEGPLVDGV
jgi:hypothetical protein